jgi:hypothetical protein
LQLAAAIKDFTEAGSSLAEIFLEDRVDYTLEKDGVRRREFLPPMNEHNPKSSVSQVNASKNIVFSSHFLVISSHKTGVFCSFFYANLR